MESFIIHAGYAAVFLFGFLEACCVPIPSEITFGYAGVLAGEGRLNVVAIIIIGTIAELLGSLVAYGVGRGGERPLVARFGRYLLITQADIDRPERFLAGPGGPAGGPGGGGRAAGTPGRSTGHRPGTRRAGKLRHRRPAHGPLRRGRLTPRPPTV